MVCKLSSLKPALYFQRVTSPTHSAAKTTDPMSSSQVTKSSGHTHRSGKYQRVSHRFALATDPLEAEARRKGIELLANQGLLSEVFKYFDAADVGAFRRHGMHALRPESRCLIIRVIENMLRLSADTHHSTYAWPPHAASSIRSFPEYIPVGWKSFCALSLPISGEPASKSEPPIVPDD